MGRGGSQNVSMGLPLTVNAVLVPSTLSNGRWKPLTRCAVRYGARPMTGNAACKKHPGKKDRPKTGDAEASIVKAAKAKAEDIKNFAYALGKASEHLTENQQAKVAMIAENNSRLYRAYRMKEPLRLLLKIKDVDAA